MIINCHRTARLNGTRPFKLESRFGTVMYPGFVSVSVMCSTDVSVMCSTDYAEGLENVFHTCVY